MILPHALAAVEGVGRAGVGGPHAPQIVAEGRLAQHLCVE